MPQSLKGTTRPLYFCLLMFFTSAAVVCQIKMEYQPEWWLLTSSIALTEHNYSIFYMKLSEVKKILRKQSLKRNSNKRKLQFLISPNNLNSLFVLLMVTQTLVHSIFSKGKSPQLASAHFTNAFLIFCTFPPKALS